MEIFNLHGKRFNVNNLTEASNYCFYMAFWALNEPNEQHLYLKAALVFRILKSKVEPYTLQEYITIEDNNWACWKCVCGNTHNDEGFFPCDKNGNRLESFGTFWDEHSICERCGRIIDHKVLKVISRSPLFN